MKKTAFILVLLMVSTPVYAENDYGELNLFTETIQEFSFSDAVDALMQGRQIVNVNEMWKNVYEYAVSEVRANISAVAVVFALSLLFALLSTAQIQFQSKGAADAAFLIVYMIVTGVLLAAFGEISKSGISLIENIVLFANTIVPILGTAIVSSAGAGVFSVLAPQILIFSNLVGNIIKNIGLPAVYFALALSLMGNLSERFSLAPLGKVIRNAAIWVVSGVVTLFCAVVAVSGISSGTMNAAVLRGAKFAVSGTLPVLGGILSDSVEAVVGGAMVIKNAVGAAGIIFILISALYPVVKITVVIFLYKITAAVMGCFGDKRIIGILNDMAGVLSCIVGFIAACAAAVVISLSILIGASNMGGMLK